MELNKIKRLLAEENPDRKLENIIEKLSEGSEIPLIRQRARAKVAGAKVDKTEAEVNQLKVSMEKAKGNPILYNELKRKLAELEANKARERIADSFVDETSKEIKKGDRDPMTGMPTNESMKIPLKKQNLEPTIKAPDPEVDDYDQDGLLDKINEEENTMEKNDKILFEESLANIFKILKEEDEEKTEEEIAVGEVPAVESPEVELPVDEKVVEVEPGQEEVQAEEPVLEPELQANDAELAGEVSTQPEMEEIAPEAMEEMPAEEAMDEQPEMEEIPAEEAMDEQPETVEIPTNVEPEVMVTNSSIRVEIPIMSNETIPQELGELEAEALQEAFRTLYRLLDGNVLNEGEEVSIPEDSEAEVKVEDGVLVIEIPLHNPKEEVSEEDAQELQEAVAVISYLLKEELEASEPEEQQYKVEKEIAPTDAPDAVVKSEIKSGEIVIQPHDHADAEGKKVRDAVIQEGELPAELKANTYDDPSDEDSIPEALEDESEEEMVKVPEGNVEADIEVKDNVVRIEIPLNQEEELSVSEEDGESLSETIKFVYSLFKSRSLLESEEVVVPQEAEADVKIEDGKLIIEIPIESPEEEMSEEQVEALQEAVNYLSFLLLNEKGILSAYEDMAAAGGLSGTQGGVAAAAAAAAEAGAGLVGATATTGLSTAAIAASLGIPAALAAGWLATPNGRKFIATRLKLGKVGKAYKDVRDIDKKEMGLQLNKAADAKIAAKKEFMNAKAKTNSEKLQAKKGIDFGTRLMAKVPLLNKLANTNLFGWKPLQNKDVAQRIVDRKAKVISGIEQKLPKGLLIDKNSGRIKYDSTEFAKLTPAQQQDVLRKSIEFKNSVKSAGDFKDSVGAFEQEFDKVKGQSKIDMAKAADIQNKAMVTADKDAQMAKLLRKDKDYQDLLYQKSQAMAKLNESMAGYDVNESFNLLEGLDFTFDEKLDILSESYELEFFVLLKEQFEELGIMTNEKGINFFLESKGVDLKQEEKDGINKSLNSEEVKKEFENYYEAKRHLDIKPDEITNKDMETGMDASDLVAPVIKESEELGSAAAEPVHSNEAPKEHTPEVKNSDVFPSEEHQQAEEVEAVIVESEEKPEAKELNSAGSDTLNSEGEIVEGEEPDDQTPKAEPKDVTVSEAVNYRSLKEAFLLEADYFSTPERKEKLISQLGLLVARDVKDPLYEELIRTSAVAKELQEQLQSKYKAVAMKKANELISRKNK
jgi:hypothetical protein